MNSSNQNQLEKLRKRLESIPQDVRNAVKPALDTSAHALADEMRRLCPVDTGALRDSITVVPGALETGFKVVTHSPAALPIEFGTSRMPAQPFFLPAYRSLRTTIIGNLKTAVVAAVKAGGND